MVPAAARRPAEGLAPPLSLLPPRGRLSGPRRGPRARALAHLRRLALDRLAARLGSASLLLARPGPRDRDPGLPRRRGPPPGPAQGKQTQGGGPGDRRPE